MAQPVPTPAPSADPELDQELADIDALLESDDEGFAQRPGPDPGKDTPEIRSRRRTYQKMVANPDAPVGQTGHTRAQAIAMMAQNSKPLSYTPLQKGVGGLGAAGYMGPLGVGVQRGLFNMGMNAADVIGAIPGVGPIANELVGMPGTHAGRAAMEKDINEAYFQPEQTAHPWSVGGGEAISQVPTMMLGGAGAEALGARFLPEITAQTPRLMRLARGGLRILGGLGTDAALIQPGLRGNVSERAIPTMIGMGMGAAARGAQAVIPPLAEQISPRLYRWWNNIDPLTGAPRDTGVFGPENPNMANLPEEPSPNYMGWGGGGDPYQHGFAFEDRPIQAPTATNPTPPESVLFNNPYYMGGPNPDFGFDFPTHPYEYPQAMPGMPGRTPGPVTRDVAIRQGFDPRADPLLSPADQWSGAPAEPWQWEDAATGGRVSPPYPNIERGAGVPEPLPPPSRGGPPITEPAPEAMIPGQFEPLSPEVANAPPPTVGGGEPQGELSTALSAARGRADAIKRELGSELNDIPQEYHGEIYDALVKDIAALSKAKTAQQVSVAQDTLLINLEKAKADVRVKISKGSAPKTAKVGKATAEAETSGETSPLSREEEATVKNLEKLTTEHLDATRQGNAKRIEAAENATRKQLHSMGFKAQEIEDHIQRMRDMHADPNVAPPSSAESMPIREAVDAGLVGGGSKPIGKQLVSGAPSDVQLSTARLAGAPGIMEKALDAMDRHGIAPGLAKRLRDAIEAKAAGKEWTAEQADRLVEDWRKLRARAGPKFKALPAEDAKAINDYIDQATAKPMSAGEMRAAEARQSAERVAQVKAQAGRVAELRAGVADLQRRIDIAQGAGGHLEQVEDLKDLMMELRQELARLERGGGGGETGRGGGPPTTEAAGGEPEAAVGGFGPVLWTERPPGGGGTGMRMNMLTEREGMPSVYPRPAIGENPRIYDIGGHGGGHGGGPPGPRIDVSPDPTPELTAASERAGLGGMGEKEMADAQGLGLSILHEGIKSPAQWAAEMDRRGNGVFTREQLVDIWDQIRGGKMPRRRGGEGGFGAVGGANPNEPTTGGETGGRVGKARRIPHPGTREWREYMEMRGAVRASQDTPELKEVGRAIHAENLAQMAVTRGHLPPSALESARRTSLAAIKRAMETDPQYADEMIQNYREDRYWNQPDMEDLISEFDHAKNVVQFPAHQKWIAEAPGLRSTFTDKTTGITHRVERVPPGYRGEGIGDVPAEPKFQPGQQVQMKEGPGRFPLATGGDKEISPGVWQFTDFQGRVDNIKASSMDEANRVYYKKLESDGRMRAFWALRRELGAKIPPNVRAAFERLGDPLPPDKPGAE